MAGAFNLNSDGRKLSGDPAATFFNDNTIPTSEVGIPSPSSSPSPQPIGCSEDNFNGLQPSGTLLEGILQNLAIWEDTSEKGHFCTCGDRILATSYCSICQDYLCEKCVSAHNRVKVTRDHPVQKINAQSIPAITKSEMPNSSNVSKGFKFSCDEHVGGVLHLFCELCSAAICDKCAVLNHNGHRIQYLQQVIDGSRTMLLSLISQSRAKTDLFEKLSGHILTRIKNLDAQTGAVCLEVKTIFHKLLTILEHRQREIISSVQQIQQMKLQALNSQYEEICGHSNKLRKLTDDIKKDFEFSVGIDILKAKERLREELMIAEQQLAKHSHIDEETIIFTPPDISVQTAISHLGKISCEAPSPSLVFSNSAQSPTNNVMSRVNFHRIGQSNTILNNASKKDVFSSSQQFLEKSDDALPAKPFQDNTIKTLEPAELLPSDSTPRSSKPRFAFGGMGEKDGQLCRPWGVACDKNGNFVVADRSNNRIQVFSQHGAFIRKFGVAGAQPGQFNRPAGLSVDVHSRIVVADKDNHRIQVFSINGDFLFTFGERGSKNAQFYYPWDIATDSRGLIAVTDTRNHRIQIFNPHGKFIGKYGFEGILWKHFDSPRGISFANGDTSLVVTDFNNHRLVIIQSDLQSARFLGSEGNQPSQFLRPQGVAVDNCGNYVVADSRNNRLQIFSPSGTIVAILGGAHGTATDEMDRPSGVAVTPDGGVAVVDFGNNRILVY